MFFFAEILPKKYYLSGNSKEDSFHDRSGSFSKRRSISKNSPKPKPDYRWERDYVQKAEESFKQEFDELYEDVIADRIFKNNASVVNKEAFVTNICGE